MKLDIDRIEHGRSELPIAGTLQLGMGEDHPAEAAISGNLVVDNLENRFLVNGDLKATGSVPCARCLKEFMFAWDVPVEVMILRNLDSDEGEGDSLVLHQSRGEVDLRQALTECAVLAYPITAVCREDCKGLCPHCGVDRNKQSCDCEQEDYDPRWAGLDALD
ncbi:hypothetical protein CSA17_03440 [bacterium DOLJORAL78_65_58]|nr:MAG: hypothetical protein CSB20_13235 [bacterium DOLZORAL124_64_63]PIE76207.1 MAG: hypothetical protein CSA17_03440 [bacterium DOLJORAL78_65_58]